MYIGGSLFIDLPINEAKPTDRYALVCVMSSLFCITTVNYTYLLSLIPGWTAAADIAKRALTKFESPKKRTVVNDMITVDQVGSFV